VIVDQAKAGNAFDQLIAEGNSEGNRIVQDGIDALLAQTAALRRAVTALEFQGMKVLDSASLKDAGSVKKR
jgi:putative iron-regulated protein